MSKFEEIRINAQQAAMDRYREIDSNDIPLTVLSEVVDAVLKATLSTDAEPVVMDDEDRTPIPAGLDPVLWQKADEVHHAMALVARDQECVKIIYRALSCAAEPVKTAVAVKALDDAACLLETLSEGKPDDDVNAIMMRVMAERARSALSAQVQDVAGWRMPLGSKRALVDELKKARSEFMISDFEIAERIIAAIEALSASPAPKHGEEG